MSTKKEKCILMRSGSEFWVSEETAVKLEDQLIKQEKHNFVRINELNRTINTADVVEVCTAEQMDDRNRLKNKEWMCGFKKWHQQREKCFCAQEQAKERRAIKEKEERDRENRPLTPEEEKKRKKMFAETRKFLEEKGILTKKMTIEK